MEDSNPNTTSRRTLPDPAAAFWREAAVCAFLQVSRSTLRRMIAAGEFPAPVKLSAACIAFPAEEVRQWGVKRMQSRIQAGAAA